MPDPWERPGGHAHEKYERLIKAAQARAGLSPSETDPQKFASWYSILLKPLRLRFDIDRHAALPTQPLWHGNYDRDQLVLSMQRMQLDVVGKEVVRSAR